MVRAVKYSVTVAASIGILVLICLLLRVVRRNTKRRLEQIPPGPIGLPILGCLPFLSQYPELNLQRWAKTFGPLYSMWIGNQLFVVISDPQIVKDLVITNGAIFSSRKDIYVKSQIIFRGRGITTTPYGDTWRKHRRLASQFLGNRVVSGYLSRLEYEVQDMLRGLLTDGQAGLVPVSPQAYLSRLALNNIMTIVFGTRTESMDDPFIHHWLTLSREFMNCTGPVSNWVDFVPFLRNFPAFTMIERSRRLHQHFVDTCGGLVRDVKRQIDAGDNVPDCMAKFLLDVKDKERLDDLDIILLCCGFLVGGVESTAAIKQWFAAHISVLPEVQAQAQMELDRVVGRDRLPQAEDAKDLPYVRAIVKEIERVHNPFWLGTPHVSTEDFSYRGYKIPKDTAVILNTYTMHHDSQRYPNPEKFDPDRYIDDERSSAESAKLADPYQRDHWTFGAGRRICPAIALAEHEIFLAVAGLLWAFDMRQLSDAPIDLKEYDGLSGRSPVPFCIRLVPRHEHVAAVVGASCHTATCRNG
uniref:Cytochrome P450 n=1 Tax=Phanerodontia chrysosporium TaxID=2822231 RepID=G5EJV1_PHACH|nr:cytochrome P450 [Phanerodontia chrysosporium]